MSVDPTKYNIPIRHLLSFRQQVFYAEELQREQDEEAEAEARARARAEAQEARERSALEQRSSEAEELEMVNETPDLADEAEEVAGHEDTDEGAVEVEQHAVAQKSLELARRLLRRVEIPAGSDDAEAGIDDVEPQSHSEETAEVPHLTAAEAMEGADPEVTEEDAEAGEPSQSEEASTPAHPDAEDVEETSRATTDARPPRIARKAIRPARKPTTRKQAAKVAARRGSSQPRRRSHPVTVPPPPALAPLLTPPALLRGEDPAEYEDLLARVIGEVRPDGGIELVLVHDFVGRSWEIARYRRAKAAYVSSLERPALGQLLQSLGVEDSARADLLKGWMSGDAAAQARVRALLDAAGWNESVIHARSLAASLKTLEGFEDLQLTAEASRAGSWAQLVRHRADLADRFAQPQALIDAAYTEVDEQGSDEEDA
jgi:hypothetical protein